MRLSLACVVFVASAAADSLVKVEPPSPLETRRNWRRRRAEQRSLGDTLRLWGIDAEIAATDQLDTKTVPGLITAKIGLAGADRLDLSVDFGLPRNATGLQFSGSFDLSKSADASSLAGDIKLSIRGTGISTKGKWSTDRGLELEGGIAWEHALYTLGAKIDTSGGRSGDFTLKLGPARVKVDLVRWVKRAHHILPQLRDAAAKRIPKVGGVLIQLDLGSQAFTDQPPSGPEATGEVSLVSLKRALAAERVADLGEITHVFGLLVDQRGEDIILIGNHEPGAPEIPIDLVAEVFRSIHRDHLGPWVSIDPIAPLDPETRHRARFGGLSAGLEQSSLLKVMLDADYALKEMHLGDPRRSVPGVKSWYELEVEDSVRPNPVGLVGILARQQNAVAPMGRVWLTPRQPGVAEIWKLAGSEGALYFFPSGVNIQTESMRLAADTGSLQPAKGGAGNPIARRAVLGYTRQFDRLERAMPELARLRQTFELVVAAEILRSQGVRSSVLDALGRRAVAQVPHKTSYASVGPRRVGATRALVWGGADTRLRLTRARFRAVTELGAIFESLRRLPWAAPTIRAYGMFLPVVLEAKVANRALMAARWIDDASRELSAGELPASVRYLSRAIEADPSSALAHTRLGTVYYRMGRADGAIEAWSRAIELDPGHAEVHYNRGVLLALAGRWRAAAADFTSTLQADPANVQARFNLGKAKFALGDPKGAVEDYSLALSVDPGHAGSLLNRGQARSRLGDSPGAMEDYTAVLELDPRYQLAYYNRGLVKQRLGDLPGAIEDFTQAIELAPGDRDAYYSRALVHRLRGHHEKAIADYSEAIRIDARFARAYLGRAISSYGAGRRDEAIRDLEQVAALDPTNRRAKALLALWRVRPPDPRPAGAAIDLANAGTAAAQRGDLIGALRLYSRALEMGGLSGEHAAMVLLNRGMAFGELGLYAPALVDCSRAVQRSPRSADAHLACGNAQLRMGDTEKAVVHYDEAIRLRPDLALAYLNRALVFEQIGKREQAVGDYRTVLKLRPGNYSAASALQRLTGEPVAPAAGGSAIDDANAATAAGRRGDLKEALRLYSRAIDSRELSPAHLALAYYSRGVVYIKLGLFDKALADCTRARQGLPDHADVHVALGNAHLGKGDKDRAIKSYTEAIRIQPGLFLAHLNRAGVYEELGRRDEAVADYRTALELQPDDETAKSALRGLEGR